MDLMMVYIFIEWVTEKLLQLRQRFLLGNQQPAIQPIVAPCKCDCPLAALLSKREDVLTKEQLVEKLIGELSLTLHNQN